MRNRFRLTFPTERVHEPVVCQVAKQFDITFSIRRADVRANAGWIDLEFAGEDAEIDRVVEYLQNHNVRVDPIEGDIVAG